MFKTDNDDNTNERGIEQTHFVHVLSTYLNSIQSDEEEFDDDYRDDSSTVELDNEDKALNLIKSWSEPKNGFIFRFYNDEGVEMIDLTAGVERLFKYMRDVSDLKSLFIGTESRFANIIARIKELDENTIDDPLKRIDELEKKKREIDQQIQEIRESGHATTFTPLQVNERINGIEKEASDLLSDFRQLKDNNHKIFSELCHRQLETTENRGTLLSYILESSDALENSPQGQSFDSFFRYLNETLQNEDSSIASKALAIHKRLPNIKMDVDFFNKIEDSLYHSGRNVLSENHLLSERLKKVILRKNSPEYQYIAKAIKSIKTLAVENQTTMPYKEYIMELDRNAEVNNDMVRPLVLPEGEGSRQNNGYKKVEPPSFDLSQLLIDIYVNEEEIREIIQTERATAFQEGRDLTLQYIFSHHPIKYGLAEVLTYLSILFKSDYCTIDDSEKDTIYYISYETKHKIELTLPKVVINDER